MKIVQKEIEDWIKPFVAFIGGESKLVDELVIRNEEEIYKLKY